MLLWRKALLMLSKPLGADSMVHFALLADAAAGHYTAELQLTSDHKVSQIIKYGSPSTSRPIISTRCGVT